MERDYICLSRSPYGVPVLFVGKKDKKLRMCIDYQALKKITIKHNYPLPKIDYLFDRLNGARYFSRINLKSGYYKIHIMDEDVKKTMMRMCYGFYEFLVMSFRLCNSLSTFTTLMNFDAPPSSLMDLTMNPKVKTSEGEGVGAHSLVHSTLGVEGRARASGWD
jgi:hypothetical protein